MSNATDVQLVPPPVGALPQPMQSPDGRYDVILSAKWANHRYHNYTWRPGISSAKRFDRPIAEAKPWSVLMQFLTAMRVHPAGTSDLSTELTSEAEAELCRQLLSYTEYRTDWDGEGGTVPSLAAANNALSFLANRPADIPLPYPECGTEGDIGLYWDNKDARIFAEVAFEGDGTYAYFAVHGDPGAVAEKCGGENMNIGRSWPDEMLRILRIGSIA